MGVVELLNGFAILTVPESRIDMLSDLEEIEYVEKPKAFSLQSAREGALPV